MKQLFLNILFIFVCNSTFAQVDWVHYADSLEQISLHHDFGLSGNIKLYE